MMNKEPIATTETKKTKGTLLLMELEAQTMAEGQEWMRRRMEEKLAALAQEQGRLSPLGTKAAAGPGKDSHAPNQLRGA